MESETVNLGSCLKGSANWTEMVADLMAARAKFLPLLKDNTATVPMKSGGKYTYNYADLPSLLEQSLPVLREHGIHVIQAGDFDGSLFHLTTTLAHKNGAWLSNVYRMPCTGKDPQSIGSAETYARRYALMALLTVAADDDDGAAATRQATQQPANPAGNPAKPELGEWGTKLAALFNDAIKCPKDKRADLMDAATCGTHLVGDIKNETKAKVIFGIFQNIAANIPYSEMMDRLHDVRALGTDETLGDVFDASFGV